jgi:hypothetical protein
MLLKKQAALYPDHLHEIHMVIRDVATTFGMEVPDIISELICRRDFPRLARQQYPFEWLTRYLGKTGLLPERKRLYLTRHYQVRECIERKCNAPIFIEA